MEVIFINSSNSGVFIFDDGRKLVYLAVAFLVLVVPVVGFGEYQRFSSLKDLVWGFQEKDVGGSSVPDIVFNWVPEQNKVVMDFPIRVENPRDFDVVFSKVAFDVSLWGLESGGGVISQRHVVPAKGSRTLWIRNFEISVKDFENFVFSVATTGAASL